jgi:hypothetical protein
MIAVCKRMDGWMGGWMDGWMGAKNEASKYK